MIPFKSFFHQYKSIIILFFAIKITLLFFILVGRPLIPFSTSDYNINGYHYHEKGTQLENSLSAYDGQLYLELAHSGYTGVPPADPGQRIYAFFPFFPFSMRVTSLFFGGNLFFAGIILNFLFSFLAFFYLYKLVLLDYKKEIALKSVYYFVIFPAAIFFMALYSEALFFFLSVAAFYYCRKHAWWIAGIFGYLAALTRSQGILLLLPFLIEYFLYIKNQHFSSFSTVIKKTKGNFMSFFLIPLGLITFLWYAKQTTGNFFLPIEMQQTWGRASPSLLNVWNTLYLNVTHFFSLPIHSFRSSQLDVAVGMIFIVSLFLMIKRLRWSYIVYAALCVFFPLSSASTMSLVRLVSISFPHYILFAQWGNTSKLSHTVITFLSILFLSILTLRFINWYWAG